MHRKGKLQLPMGFVIEIMQQVPYQLNPYHFDLANGRHINDAFALGSYVQAFEGKEMRQISI